MKTTKNEKLEALNNIRRALKDTTNNTIYAHITKVSASGMSRRIKFYTIKDDELYYLTYNIGVLLGDNVNGDGLLAKGCGMDIIFNTLYNANCAAYELDHDGDYKYSNDICNTYIFNTDYRSL